MASALVVVARRVRPYLVSLVGQRAGEYDRRLADLLATAGAGADIDEAIAALFAEQPALRDWAAATLSHEKLLPLQARAEDERSYEPLGRSGSGVALPRYVCPVAGDVEWHRVFATDEVPRCLSHGAVLVPA